MMRGEGRRESGRGPGAGQGCFGPCRRGPRMALAAAEATPAEAGLRWPHGQRQQAGAAAGCREALLRSKPRGREALRGPHEALPRGCSGPGAGP